MSLKTYDPRRVKAGWRGIELLAEDIPEGTFIETEKLTPQTWNLEEGSDSATRTRATGNAAKIRITLRQGSVTHQKLLALAKADEVLENIIGPFTCTDPSGPVGSGFIAFDAYIEGIPNFVRATTTQNVTWTFACSRVEESHLGHSVTVGL